MILSVLKIFVPTVVAFFIGMIIVSPLSHYFYKYKMWKKYSRSSENNEGISTDFKKIHNEKGELNTPRIGGVIIWLSASITILIFFVISKLFSTDLTEKMNFLSRNQTLLPFFSLIAAALIGISDDLLQIFGKGSYAKDSRVYRKIKVATIISIGLIIGWWFFYKLGVSYITVPFYGYLDLGYFFIPFFIIVMLAVFSSSVIDGIDGLSGGILASIFGAYSGIAFFNNQIDLAAFCAVITGSILVFLWFNIPPARFYMGETGMLGLTVTLSVIAFLTDTVLILPIIAFPLVITSLSVIIQILSKKWRGGKKVFLVAPIHHHLEARGWPSYKVTMRFWVIGIVFAILGLILVLVSNQF
ncbi:MAG: hypothetical protein AAB355_02810 [Patescibacteria group bacterium]